ncbi:hypothetical protein BSG8_02110 [Bacillus subtilis subsp. natto]|nr:hypothetical protein BSNT_06529 [Bacillus subtilis subsp. natto BEST195]BCV94578.1 hypothetical protein BsBEST3136_02170 [Bacillus subtilis]BDB91459.1 hypothetical protein BSG8_02110 [Bacillus subtilis subsp. natto]GAK80222.1 hypothetical protein BSMD_021340 [Bacillus subtilis Miyagi-4]BCV98822.1 hypothetical protein BsBEST3145_02180 [Bacillus subtilis]
MLDECEKNDVLENQAALIEEDITQHLFDSVFSRATCMLVLHFLHDSECQT